MIFKATFLRSRQYRIIINCEKAAKLVVRTCLCDNVAFCFAHVHYIRLGSSSVMVVGIVPVPPKNWGCRKIFFLCENFLSKNAKFVAESPHFGKSPEHY